MEAKFGYKAYWIIKRKYYRITLFISVSLSIYFHLCHKAPCRRLGGGGGGVSIFVKTKKPKPNKCCPESRGIPLT